MVGFARSITELLHAKGSFRPSFYAVPLSIGLGAQGTSTMGAGRHVVGWMCSPEMANGMAAKGDHFGASWCCQMDIWAN